MEHKKGSMAELFSNLGPITSDQGPGYWRKPLTTTRESTAMDEQKTSDSNIKRAGLVAINASVLADVLGLPRGAKITSIQSPIDRTDLFTFRIEDADFLPAVSDGDLIPFIDVSVLGSTDSPSSLHWQ